MPMIPRIGVPTNMGLGGTDAPRLNLPGGEDWRTAASIAGLAQQGVGLVGQVIAAADARKKEEEQGKLKQEKADADAWAPPQLAQANLQTVGGFYEVLSATGDDGAGLTDRLGAKIDEIWKPYREAAQTPAQKELIERGYLNAREDWTKRGIEKEWDTRQAWRTSQADIAKNTGIATFAAAQTTEDVDLLFAQSVGGIQSAYAGIEDPALRSKVSLAAAQELADAAYARKQLLAAQTTGEVPQQGIVGPVADAIRAEALAKGEDPNVALTIAAIENPAADPKIKNPNSSALGLFQHTGKNGKGTWYDLGGTDADRLDPKRQIELGIKLQAQNRAGLRKVLGREPTGGELYLAHQQGLGGAQALLNAPGGVSAIDALATVYGNRKDATDAVLNNGGAANMTAAEFAQKWLRKFQAAAAGGAVTRLATPEGRKKGDDLAAREVEKQRDEKVGLLEIAIDAGTANRTTLDAYKRAGIIKPGSPDDVRLSKSIQTLEEKQAKEAADRAENAAIVNGALSGGIPLDPSDAKDRAAVDEDYEARSATWKPEEREANSIAYAGRVGYVPDAMKARLVGGMRSTDPEKRLAAAQTYGRLRATNQALVNGLPGDVSSDAYFLIESQRKGMTPKEAADALSFAEKLTPEDINVRDQNFRKSLGTKEANAVSYIRKEMAADKGVKDEKSLFGPDFAPPPEMMADVLWNAQRAYRKHGDWEAAMATGYDQARRVWGPSVINGEARMMKNAPEVFYGVPEMNAADNAKWMRAQAGKELGIDKPKDLRFIEAPGITNPEGRPAYFVMQQEGETLRPVLKSGKPVTWYPKWKSSPEKAKRDRERADSNAERLRNARTGRGAFLDVRDDPKSLYDAMQVPSEGGAP